MAGGSIRLYLGAEVKYTGTYNSTEEYELRSLSYSLDESTGVATCAHDDEKTLHSLSQNLTTESFMVLEHAARDPRVKVLIWTATGQRAFCSGAALKGPGPLHVPAHAADDAAARGMMNDRSDPMSTFWVPLIIAFWDFPKPIVGAIPGLGVGGGANIALAGSMDIVVLSTNARFMYPFSTLGITPEMGSSLLMPYLVGMAKAKEMMMLGNWFSAEEALALGLANEVVAPDELMDRANEIAIELTRKQAAALSLGKRVMNHHLRKGLEEVMLMEAATIRESTKLTGGPAGIPPKL